MQRRLSLTEGTSDKFWYIDVAGASVTVHYGRRGTAGSSKTKTHPSPAEALADAEKQVAAKLKKGYSDEAGASTAPLTPGEPTAAAPRSTPKSAPAKAPEAAPSAPPAAPEPEPLELPTDTQDIGWNITPFDQAMALEVPVSVERDTEPFDPDAELERAKSIATQIKAGDTYTRTFCWTFSEPLFTTIPSKERAQWWADYLNGDEKMPRMWGLRGMLLPPGIPLALEAAGANRRENLSGGMVPTLQVLGQRIVLPHLGESARRKAEAEAASAIPLPAHRVSAWKINYDMTVVHAASLGGREEDVAAAFAEVENGALASESYTYDLQSMVLAAATPEDRVRLAQRLSAHVHHPTLFLAWLIATGPAGFSFALKSLEAVGKLEGELCMAQASAAMQGPGAVPFFAEAMTGRHAAFAAPWLAAHIPQVLAATLTPSKAAPLEGTLRAVPVAQLREAQPHTTGGIRALVDQILSEADRPQLDPSTPWWAEAAVSVPSTRLPASMKPESLPPILMGEERLGPDELRLLLRALMSADRGQPLVAAVREHADVRSRDRFAVALVDGWLASGAPAKEGWRMTGAGCLGDDRFVAYLTPLIREWPGMNQHKRAVNGLDALRNVSTATALQQISGIAAKVKFAALKQRAGEAMEEIAEILGLTRDQLEDRVIPDGGLDERGTREFSYGQRRFLATLTPEAKVVARLLDEDGRPTGKVLTTLPNPLKSDDEAVAKESKAEFALLKKNLAGLAKIQAKRFEKAMMAGRRWSDEEFEAFIAHQPLLRGLLAGVVWGVYDGDTRGGLFRLDEDGSAIDADDEPVDLAGRSIGVVHPIDLTPEELSAWGEVQSDFELTTPFPQLDRPIFELPADQGDDVELHGIPQGDITPGKLFGAFTKYDWERGEPQDAGIVALHAMAFDAAGLTAVVEYEPGMWMGPIAEQDNQRIEKVRLFEGSHGAADFGWGWHEKRSKVKPVPWSSAPRSVVNEVLTVLNAMQS